MRTSEYFAVLIAILAIFCFFMFGLTSGLAKGKAQACESVKLEWVQDKCMKVTREAV
jgi:hypothetical protein